MSGRSNEQRRDPDPGEMDPYHPQFYEPPHFTEYDHPVAGDILTQTLDAPPDHSGAIHFSTDPFTSSSDIPPPPAGAGILDFSPGVEYFDPTDFSTDTPISPFAADTPHASLEIERFGSSDVLPGESLQDVDGELCVTDVVLASELEWIPASKHWSGYYLTSTTFKNRPGLLMPETPPHLYEHDDPQPSSGATRKTVKAKTGETLDTSLETAVTDPIDVAGISIQTLDSSLETEYSGTTTDSFISSSDVPGISIQTLDTSLEMETLGVATDPCTSSGDVLIGESPQKPSSRRRRKTVKVHQWAPQTDPRLETKRQRALKAFEMRQKQGNEQQRQTTKLEKLEQEVDELRDEIGRRRCVVSELEDLLLRLDTQSAEEHDQ